MGVMCVFCLVFTCVHCRCWCWGPASSQSSGTEASSRLTWPMLVGEDYLGGLVIRKRSTMTDHILSCVIMPFFQPCHYCSLVSSGQVTKEQQLMLMFTQLFSYVPFLSGGSGRGEKWGGMILDKYQLTSLFFIRLKSRQKNSRKSKQIWTTMLREKLLFLRIEHFSDKDSE